MNFDIHIQIEIEFKRLMARSTSRRSHVERDGDRAGRTAREEGGQAARRRGAAHTQPRAGAPRHQAGQHPRVPQRLLAHQAMRLRRDQTNQHRGAKTQ